MGGKSTPVCVSLAIPKEHPAYAGHFPGNPLVPGALLLSWLQQLVERESACDGALAQETQLKPLLREVSSIKFMVPVRPGDLLSIEILQRASPNKLAVTATGPDGVVCKAAFVLEER